MVWVGLLNQVPSLPPVVHTSRGGYDFCTGVRSEIRRVNPECCKVTSSPNLFTRVNRVLLYSPFTSVTSSFRPRVQSIRVRSKGKRGRCIESGGDRKNDYRLHTRRKKKGSHEGVGTMSGIVVS